MLLATTKQARAALLGLAVGDALGVPVEFQPRAARRQDPIIGMRAYGTHHQPAGTWSDDSSLTFCLAETMAIPGGRSGPPDLADFARRSINWLVQSYWTATGKTFDVGNATRVAIGRLERGTEPTAAGPRSEFDNGNGGSHAHSAAGLSRCLASGSTGFGCRLGAHEKRGQCHARSPALHAGLLSILAGGEGFAGRFGPGRCVCADAGAG